MHSGVVLHFRPADPAPVVLNMDLSVRAREFKASRLLALGAVV